MEVIYVAWPLKAENGFTEILRANGKLARIGDNAIRQLRKDGGSLEAENCLRARWSDHILRLIPAFPSGIEPERNSSCRAVAVLAGALLRGWPGDIRRRSAYRIRVRSDFSGSRDRWASTLIADRGTWERCALVRLSADNFWSPKPCRIFAWSNGRSVPEASGL